MGDHKAMSPGAAEDIQNSGSAFLESCVKESMQFFHGLLEKENDAANWKAVLDIIKPSPAILVSKYRLQISADSPQI